MMVHIYIVGYPKSGNTWLTRMIAKITGFPVDVIDGSQSEIAMDVNRELERQNDSINGRVFKLHEMPHNFENRLAQEKDEYKTKVIYVYRDIEDVFVSSFFYFKGNNKKRDVKNHSIERYIEKFGDVDPIGLKWLSKRVYWRVQFNRYLRSFIRHGYNKDAMTYANHLSAWFTYLKSCDSKFEYTVTKYEDLIDDTAKELERICNRIGFYELNMEALETSAKSESFSVRKKDIEKTSAELTFSKEFNLKFLRAGKVGDHKRFLTKGQTILLRKTIQNIVAAPSD